MPQNVTSNEVVHVTDIFTTVLAMAGATKPDDRPIDCINQVSLFQSPKAEKSKRKGFLFYIKGDLRAIKWRHWKLHLVWEPKVNQSSGKLESPYLFNLRDSKEESDILAYNTWVLQPMMKLRTEFEKSLGDDPARAKNGMKL